MTELVVEHRKNGSEFAEEHLELQALVAGDDPSLRSQVLDWLNNVGVHCHAGHAVGLEQATDRVSQFTPHLTILLEAEDHQVTMRTLLAIDRVKSVDGRVIVIGPAKDPHTILNLLHAGADSYINRDNLKEELGVELLRLRRLARIKSSGRTRGRVIGVLGATGGAGASSIAASVATCLAKAHGEAALVDLRLAASDLSALMDVQPQYSLAELSERVERVDAEMFNQFLARHSSGVHLIAGPMDQSEANSVTPRGVCRALALACQRFPYVIVDMDNRLDEVQTEAVWQMQTLLVVLRLDYPSIRNTQRLLPALEERGGEALKIRLVANRYRQPKQISIRQAEAALGRSIDSYIQDDTARMNRSINKGSPVVLTYPRSLVTRQLSDLAMSVNGQHR